MQTESTFCPARDRPVRVAWTAAPTHEGHATIPDAPQAVCLEAAECTGRTCPVTGMARAVMLARLATYTPD